MKEIRGFRIETPQSSQACSTMGGHGKKVLALNLEEGPHPIILAP